MKNKCCSNCGAPLKDGAKHCTNCGTPVKKSTNKGFIVIVLVLVLIVIALVGAIIAFAAKDRPVSEQSESVTQIMEEPSESETEPTAPPTTKRDLTKEWKEAYKQEIEKSYNIMLEQSAYEDMEPWGYYHLADFYGDEIPELIIHKGTCEADALFDFYTYTADGLQFLGTTGAGHCQVEVKDKTCYLNCGHMGYQSVYTPVFENGEIKTKEVYVSDGEVPAEEYRQFGDPLTYYEMDDFSPFE